MVAIPNCSRRCVDLIVASGLAFAQHQAGNVGIIFGLALLPIFGLAGAAVDYTRGSGGKNELQRATDAAALAAVLAKVPFVSQREALARKVFEANKPSTASATTVDVAVTSTAVTVTATGAVKTAVTNVMGFDQIPVAAMSRAEKVFAGPPPCIVALNKTAPGAITFAGSSSFAATGCVVHTNSTSSSALTFEGTSGTATAAGFCSVGGVSTSRTVTPKPESYCDPMSDPFEKLTYPASSGCTFNNVVVEPNQTRTLTPGVYCNGLALKGKATLEAGVYVIKNGPLTVTSQAVVTGKDVSFFLTGTNAGFTVDAGSTLDLRAPTTGNSSGLLIVQDRVSNPGFENKLSGGGNSLIIGAVYAPTQKVTMSGGSGFGQKSPFMPIIADQIRVSGSASSNTNMIGISTPSPLPKSLSGARLTQ